MRRLISWVLIGQISRRGKKLLIKNGTPGAFTKKNFYCHLMIKAINVLQMNHTYQKRFLITIDYCQL